MIEESLIAFISRRWFWQIYYKGLSIFWFYPINLKRRIITMFIAHNAVAL